MVELSLTDKEATFLRVLMDHIGGDFDETDRALQGQVCDKLYKAGAKFYSSQCGFLEGTVNFTKRIPNPPKISKGIASYNGQAAPDSEA